MNTALPHRPPPAEARSSRPSWRGLVLLFACFAGLCTLFAAVVTAFDGWREHRHAAWPAVQAHVASCEIHEYQGQSRSFHLRCRVAYTVADHNYQAPIASTSVPDPATLIWHSAGAVELGDLQAWLDSHPAGTPIEVHYDPDHPGTAALVSTDMPLAGPRAARDLRLVESFGLPCVLLLLIGFASRPRQRGQSPAA